MNNELPEHVRFDPSSDSKVMPQHWNTIPAPQRNQKIAAVLVLWPDQVCYKDRAEEAVAGNWARTAVPDDAVLAVKRTDIRSGLGASSTCPYDAAGMKISGSDMSRPK